MIKEELLAKAKKDYPIGTLVQSLVPNYTYIITHEVINTFSEKSLWFRSKCNHYNIEIYRNGRWAKIIEYPKGFKLNKEINYEIY